MLYYSMFTVYSLYSTSREKIIKKHMVTLDVVVRTWVKPKKLSFLALTVIVLRSPI